MASRIPTIHYAAFAFSCAYTLLAFCQLTIRTDSFPSDMLPHVQFVLDPEKHAASAYSLLHVLCGWMLGWSRLTGLDAIPVAGGAMLVLVTAACYGSIIAVHGYLKQLYPEREEWRLTGCTIASFFVSMIILHPWLKGVLYLGVFTPNPWHNPTYLFGRFFSIVAFCVFVALVAPGQRATRGKLLALAAFLALSVWGKPSFLIGFLPASLAVLIWGWWRQWFALAHAGRLASALVPAVLVLAWINHKVFASGAASDKVIFAPGQGWGVYTPSFSMSIALGMMFPLYAVAVKARSLSPLMITASLTWLVSCACFLLLAESGLRAQHANFAWCYMSGMFFLHFAAVGEWFLGAPLKNRMLWWLGTVLFGLHLISGVRYFLQVLSGGSYM